VEEYPPGIDPCMRRKQSQDRKRGSALPAPALTDERHAFPARDPKRNAIDGRHRTTIGLERGSQILDVKQWERHR
jgi:hypothetical protein